MTPPQTSGDTDLGEYARPAASRTDTGTLTVALREWLALTLGPEARPRVTDLSVPTEAGMSSDSIMFTASWNGPEGPVDRRLVGRLAPRDDTMPVFPRYDLALQADVMRAVSAASAVPVPEVLWFEDSADHLGREFLVMERIDGEIPPDVMPYNFGSWVADGTEPQRARLQTSSIQVLADLHAIPEPWSACPRLAAGAGPVAAADALRDHLAAQRAYYEWVCADGPRSPLIERALDQLANTLPEIPGPAALCWGDARIGNIVYRDFRAAAVLDWEMAALGPREMDLGWMIFLHRFFEDIAAAADLSGLPGLLRRDDVADEYTRLAGHAPASLDWFVTYAALRQAVIMFRIQCRTVTFGQAEAPDDPDDMIMHRASLEKMLAGTYWTGIDTGGSRP
ncbi:phosphotransferase family protein [Tomitella gaofuii]|uniref:phosphotransferase family protein n=1 Tax=Tomitella gaofuii TaxID=2760083 RepID=UPI0015FA7492|nr:phosphotransferase family protein [Tomitella gaofuii]